MFEKMMKISLVVLVFAIGLAIVDGLVAQPVAYVPEVLSNDYESFIAPEPEPVVYESQAERMARNYIDTMPFSEEGLVEQLVYEGFTREEALMAVWALEIDWEEQAYYMAVNYLDVMSFSESGLIEQLEYEGFTYAEATRGVERAYR